MNSAELAPIKIPEINPVPENRAKTAWKKGFNVLMGQAHLQETDLKPDIFSPQFSGILTGNGVDPKNSELYQKHLKLSGILETQEQCAVKNPHAAWEAKTGKFVYEATMPDGTEQIRDGTFSSGDLLFFLEYTQDWAALPGNKDSSAVLSAQTEAAIKDLREITYGQFETADGPTTKTYAEYAQAKDQKAIALFSRGKGWDENQAREEFASLGFQLQWEYKAQAQEALKVKFDLPMEAAAASSQTPDTSPDAAQAAESVKQTQEEVNKLTANGETTKQLNQQLTDRATAVFRKIKKGFSGSEQEQQEVGVAKADWLIGQILAPEAEQLTAVNLQRLATKTYRLYQQNAEEVDGKMVVKDAKTKALIDTASQALKSDLEGIEGVILDSDADISQIHRETSLLFLQEAFSLAFGGQKLDQETIEAFRHLKLDAGKIALDLEQGKSITNARQSLLENLDSVPAELRGHAIRGIGLLLNSEQNIQTFTMLDRMNRWLFGNPAKIEENWGQYWNEDLKIALPEKALASLIGGARSVFGTKEGGLGLFLALSLLLPQLMSSMIQPDNGQGQ